MNFFVKIALLPNLLIDSACTEDVLSPGTSPGTSSLYMQPGTFVL